MEQILELSLPDPLQFRKILTFYFHTCLFRGAYQRLIQVYHFHDLRDLGNRFRSLNLDDRLFDLVQLQSYQTQVFRVTGSTILARSGSSHCSLSLRFKIVSSTSCFTMYNDQRVGSKNSWSRPATSISHLPDSTSAGQPGLHIEAGRNFFIAS